MPVKPSAIEIVTPGFWAIADPALTEAAKRAGNWAKLAERLGTSRHLVSKWKNHSRMPSLANAIKIESILLISKKAIRPDVDWQYLDSEKILRFDEESGI